MMLKTQIKRAFFGFLFASLANGDGFTAFCGSPDFCGSADPKDHTRKDWEIRMLPICFETSVRDDFNPKNIIDNLAQSTQKKRLRELGKIPTENRGPFQELAPTFLNNMSILAADKFIKAFQDPITSPQWLQKMMCFLIPTGDREFDDREWEKRIEILTTLKTMTHKSEQIKEYLWAIINLVPQSSVACKRDIFDLFQALCPLDDSLTLPRLELTQRMVEQWLPTREEWVQDERSMLFQGRDLYEDGVRTVFSTLLDPHPASEWILQMVERWLDNRIDTTKKARILSILSEIPRENQEWIQRMAEKLISLPSPTIQDTLSAFSKLKTHPFSPAAQDWIEAQMDLVKMGRGMHWNLFETLETISLQIHDYGIMASRRDTKEFKEFIEISHKWFTDSMTAITPAIPPTVGNHNFILKSLLKFYTQFPQNLPVLTQAVASLVTEISPQPVTESNYVEFFSTAAENVAKTIIPQPKEGKEKGVTA